MWLPLVLSVGVLSTLTTGARILGVFLTPSYSHQIMFQPIWKELSLRGHQVTVYTPCPLNDPTLTNLTEYDLGFSFVHLDRIGELGYSFDKLFEAYLNTSESQLNHEFLKDLIKNANNDTYDLLLVEYIWQPYYAFKELYNVPMVGMVSLPLTLGALRSIGMDRHAVVEPEFFLGYESADTFEQRVKSFVYSWAMKLLGPLKVNSVFEEQIAKHFGNVGKSVGQLTREVSVVLANYNFVNQKPKPMTPQFVPVSAVHVQPQQSLPQDLKEVLDNETHDVIYFSMGTNLDASKVSREMLERFFNVLGNMPYKVLFKHSNESSLGNLPGNFLVRKWFPQQDILGHPKVKLFITQGGIQSIDESISRKVPLLMVPVFADQKQNTNRCVKLGIAESINFQSFTEEELKEKILKLLSDHSYQKHLQRQHDILVDQPMSSLDTATFWIEYVLRHKGAPHLQYEAVKLPFYQNYHVDVIGFLAIMTFVLVHICKKILIIAVLSVKAMKRLMFACTPVKGKTKVL